ncbi:conserved Plasmodium protein, unknown function [Plasmodium yoelii]|uniref:Uncharacterized protein n=3 Tax=Plasmodium yoelii TaxID=5861 RepID=A0AAE9WQV6_PLAYO|nr:conserved Plasmodium protein, unknown function [Plasmodium yoelii]WBY58597.1 hypothetical protein Py17XNL_001105608 [Plasmodium yoelii yoelii]CDU18897.1 conserved Plasmodium protein, unknown function [Plasmodium yoelii]VTZ79482.1 conserved Plasmodium protein, unknown function [Plasmodium yoelii]|eukprot:XP_724492.2 conserved Plasmodium protein, unknown function [Plasmodium yoelii]
MTMYRKYDNLIIEVNKKLKLPNFSGIKKDVKAFGNIIIDKKKKIQILKYSKGKDTYFTNYNSSNCFSIFQEKKKCNNNFRFSLCFFSHNTKIFYKKWDTKFFSENKKNTISFEHIVRILKSLNKGNKNVEKNIDFLLPHIYAECEQNYIHFSCILHNFHKLRNNLSKNYKVKVYEQFKKQFINNINMFTLKEITIILKCLLEEKVMNSHKIITFCAYIFIYYINMDILYKMNKMETTNISYNFLSILNTHFRECVNAFFIYEMDKISNNLDINNFYKLIYNLNELNKDTEINYIQNQLLKYSSNSFNLHDISAFMNLLKNYNLKCFPFYIFLSHIYISYNFMDNSDNYLEQNIEKYFLKYEINKNYIVMDKKEIEKMVSKSYNNMNNSENTNVCINIAKNEKKKHSYNLHTLIKSTTNESKNFDEYKMDKEKIDQFETNKTIMNKKELIYYFKNVYKNKLSCYKYNTSNNCINNTDFDRNDELYIQPIMLNKDIKKKKKYMDIRENVHSFAVIIYTSIKWKYINKFLYILSNYLLLKYINFINLFDICNIFELFMCDRYILKKNCDLIFGKVKNLILNEKNNKTFAIFCINITRNKNELKNNFNDKIISLYKIILNKQHTKIVYNRENTVIFYNIINFLIDQEISSIFYLCYLNKFNKFLSLAIHQEKNNNDNNKNSVFTIIDIHDLVKTFINILKIYETNNKSFSIFHSNIISTYFNKSIILMLTFLKDIFFTKLIFFDTHNSETKNNTDNNLKKIKNLNRVCHILCLFVSSFKKLQIHDNLINNSTSTLFYQIFGSFKNYLYKNYEHLFSNNITNKKDCVNILNIIFMINSLNSNK